MMRPLKAGRHAGWMLLAASFTVLSLASGNAWADKLIVFKNGKVMRAKDVKVENGWTMASLGKDGTVGVRSDDVASIEDASGGGGEATPNVASTEGRGVAREGGGGPSRSDDSDAEVSGSIQDRIEQRQQELQEKQAQEAAEAPPAVVVPGLRPLQQFNQPAAGRGFRRSRNINAPPVPGSRAATGIQQIQQREDVQEVEEDGNDDE